MQNLILQEKKIFTVEEKKLKKNHKEVFKSWENDKHS